LKTKNESSDSCGIVRFVGSPLTDRDPPAGGEQSCLILIFRDSHISEINSLSHFHILMFISFAPPKETNQRKGGRKRQPVPLAALRVGTGSHRFRFAIAQQ